MNEPKVKAEDDIRLMIGSPRQYSCCEVDRVSEKWSDQPELCFVESIIERFGT